jgi:hypothetical protein
LYEEVLGLGSKELQSVQILEDCRRDSVPVEKDLPEVAGWGLGLARYSVL